jgi:hypothetical protein
MILELGPVKQPAGRDWNISSCGAKTVDGCGSDRAWFKPIINLYLEIFYHLVTPQDVQGWYPKLGTDPAINRLM